MNKLLVVCGPTVTGKTNLAIRLARKFNGELISADSRQVYKGMDVGTGKLPSSGKWNLACRQAGVESGKLRKGAGLWKVDWVGIHLYDVVEPNEQFSAADFYELARKTIRKIWQRGKLPILVGGTGLYIKVVLEGLDTLGTPANYALREKLESLSLEKLQNQLQKVNPQRAGEMNHSDWSNPRRLIRAIEVVISIQNLKVKNKNLTNAKMDVLKIGLIADRKVLDKRADKWVGQVMDNDLDVEVKKLIDQGNRSVIPMQGMIYKPTIDFVEKKITEKDWKIKLSTEMHAYISRQLTWFKKDNEIIWFDIDSGIYPQNVQEL